MRPRDVGRNGSATKVFVDPKWVRAYCKHLKVNLGYGNGLPNRCFVRKRLKKVWHVRLRREDRERAGEDGR